MKLHPTYTNKLEFVYVLVTNKYKASLYIMGGYELILHSHNKNKFIQRHCAPSKRTPIKS